MAIRIKSRKLKKRTVGITKRKTNNRLKKGVGRMTVAIQINNSEIESENVKLDCMSNIRKRARSAMKKKNLTEQDIRKFLGLKKYEN